MYKILEKYLHDKKDVQIVVREKQMEGTIESINNDLVHLVGDKYEYYIPLEKIVIIGCKVDNKERKQKKAHQILGFKLATTPEQEKEE